MDDHNDKENGFDAEAPVHNNNQRPSEEDIHRSLSTILMDTITAKQSCQCVQEDGHGTIRPENHPEVFIPVIPDGGYGWVVVFASFMNSFILDGIAYAFGVLMPELCDAFDAPKSRVSMIGSLLCGVYMGTGPMASAIVNKYGCRVTSMIGAVLSCVAFFFSAFASSINVLILTYGVMGGFGFGFIYLPSIIIVNQYFEKKRLVAVGIAVCGTGFGAFAFPPFLSYLLKVYHWTNAMMILAGILLNCAIFGALMRPLKAPISDLMVDSTDEYDKNKMTMSMEDSVEMEKLLVAENDNKTPAPTFHPHIAENILKEVEKYERKDQSVYGPRLGMDQQRASLNPIITSMSHIPNDVQRHCDLRNSTWISSVPNLNAEHSVIHRDKIHTPGPRLLLPPSVSKEDYSRPLYRKDIFYSGSILQLTSQNVIKHLDSAKAAAFEHELTPGSQLFGSYIMSMTHIPIEDPTVTHMSLDTDSKWRRLCQRFALPKVVKDVLTEMTDFSLLRHPGFFIYCLSNVLFIGYWTPNFYLPDFAAHNNVGNDMGPFLLSLMGVFNLLGRPLFNALSGVACMTPLLVNNITLLLSGFITFFVPFMVTFVPLAAYASVYGLLVAAPVALTSPLLCIMVGVDKLTNAFGLISLARGISSSVGPPLSGLVADLTGDFNSPFIFSAIFTVLCAILCFLIHLPRFQKDQRAEFIETSEFGSQALFQSATQLHSQSVARVSLLPTESSIPPLHVKNLKESSD